jgi:hypothetical protein
VTNNGSFFLGSGATDLPPIGASSTPAFTFSGLSTAQFGGAIINSGTLTVTDSSFERNFTNPATGGAGGAIQNSRSTAAARSSISMLGVAVVS